MLERLIDLFGFKRMSFRDYQDGLDESLRKEESEKVKQYCLEKGLGIYPEPIDIFPDFAEEVDKYIEGKARCDLPECQFQGRLNLDNLAEQWEIAGILGYNGGLSEVCYSAENQHLVSAKRRGRVIETNASAKLKFDKDKLEQANSVILWHTHPDGFGELSTGDVENNRDLLNSFLHYFPNKSMYMVIFLPEKSKSFWYEVKKAQPLK